MLLHFSTKLYNDLRDAFLEVGDGIDFHLMIHDPCSVVRDILALVSRAGVLLDMPLGRLPPGIIAERFSVIDVFVGNKRELDLLSWQLASRGTTHTNKGAIINLAQGP